MDRTNRRSTPTKTQTVLQYIYVLPNTYYEGIALVEIHQAAKYHPSSGHYIELAIVQKLVLVKLWTGPTAVAPRTGPSQFSNIYICSS
jgi:hypothetical protein